MRHQAKASQTEFNSGFNPKQANTPFIPPKLASLGSKGEVLLNVVFTADGQIRVLKVVHGLGHGLDEAALRAAQGVKFTPAMRDGHPVDSTATLHIVFQLS